MVLLQLKKKPGYYSKTTILLIVINYMGENMVTSKNHG